MLASATRPSTAATATIGPVVRPPGELLVAPSPADAGARHPHLDEHLVGLQRGLEEAREELVTGDLAGGPPGPCTTTVAAEREQRGRAGRRPGRRARASRRSCRGGAPAGRRPARPRAASSGTSARSTSERSQVVVPGAARRSRPRRRRPGRSDSSGDAADVDQHLGHRQPQLHHRQQRVAAGQQLGVLAVLGEQRRAPRRPSRPGRSRTATGSCAAPLPAAGRPPAGRAAARTARTMLW